MPSKSLTLVNSQTEGQLKIDSGKCAKIESSRTSPKPSIVAKNLRGSVSKVTLWKWMVEDKNIYLAFCFELKKEKYFAAVNPETSQVQGEKMDNSEEVEKKFLFKWVYKQNGWNNLSSVADPSKYLCVSGNAFTLSSEPITSFQFDELKSNTRVMKSRRLSSRYSPL